MLEPAPAEEDLPDAPAPDNPVPEAAPTDDDWFNAAQNSTPIQSGSTQLGDWAKDVIAH